METSTSKKLCLRILFKVKLLKVHSFPITRVWGRKGKALTSPLTPSSQVAKAGTERGRMDVGFGLKWEENCTSAKMVHVSYQMDSEGRAVAGVPCLAGEGAKQMNRRGPFWAALEIGILVLFIYDAVFNRKDTLKVNFCQITFLNVYPSCH